MNRDLIKKELFFKDYGYTLLATRQREHEPLERNDDINQGLFEFTINTTVRPDKIHLSVTMCRNAETTEFQGGDIDEFAAEVVESMHRCVELFGEEHDFTLEDWSEWEEYLRTYVTNTIKLEYLLAKNVVFQMGKSDLKF